MERAMSGAKGCSSFQGTLIPHEVKKSKVLIILGPFLTIEYFCLITEINTAPAGLSLQGYYEKGL